MFLSLVNALSSISAIAILFDAVRRLSWRDHPVLIAALSLATIAMFAVFAQFSMVRSVPAPIVLISIIVAGVSIYAYPRLDRAGWFCVR